MCIAHPEIKMADVLNSHFLPRWHSPTVVKRKIARRVIGRALWLRQKPPCTAKAEENSVRAVLFSVGDTCRLQTCRLADYRLADLQTADLQSCRLQTCRLADLQTADCRLQTADLQTCDFHADIRLE